MRVSYISNYKNFKDKNLTIALGFFDGFHLGHIEVLRKTIEVSRNTNTKSAILTFDCSFFDYFNKKKIENLMSLDAKINYAKNLGFDNLYVVELTDDFISLNRDEFYNVFLKDMANLVMGFDYTFGANAQGNVDYLKTKTNNIYVIDSIDSDNVKIGTRDIKLCLLNGDIKKANHLLGYNYYIEGYISKRNTNYIMSKRELLIPRNGHYKMRLIGEGINIEFDGKIKRKLPDENIIIKTENNDFMSRTFKRHLMYKIEFISELSEID